MLPFSAHGYKVKITDAMDALVYKEKEAKKSSKIILSHLKLSLNQTQTTLFSADPSFSYFLPCEEKGSSDDVASVLGSYFR